MLRELALDYPTDGIELDLSAPPGGGPMALRPDQVTMLQPWAHFEKYLYHNCAPAHRRRSMHQCSRSG